MANRPPPIDRTCSERKVQVGVATFVIAEMDVAQPRVESVEQDGSRIRRRTEVRVTDAQVPAEGRNRVEEGSQRFDRIEEPGNIFEHQPEAALLSQDHQSSERFEIALDG